MISAFSLPAAGRSEGHPGGHSSPEHHGALSLSTMTARPAHYGAYEGVFHLPTSQGLIAGGRQATTEGVLR